MSMEIVYSGTGAKTIGMTVIGALAGGGIGLITGWFFGRPLEGAFFGSLAGAGIGGVSGYLEEQEYLKNHEPEGEFDIIFGPLPKKKQQNRLVY